METNQKNLEENFSHEPHHLIGKLKVRKENIMASLNNCGDTQVLVADYCWGASGTNDSLGEENSIAYLLSLEKKWR